MSRLRALRIEWPRTEASPPLILGPGSEARIGRPRPARIAARVDFPDPVSPRMPRTSPSSTPKLTPRSATHEALAPRAGYSTDRSLTVMAAFELTFRH